MLSATDFFPLFITILMKRAISWLPCFGSGSTTRAGWEPLRDIVIVSLNRHPCPKKSGRPDRAPQLGLRTLGAVLRARLATLGDAGAIEAAAHRVVAHARQILDAAAADQHHRVLLQIVAFATDVADHLVAIGQAHLGNLAQGRVRLFRGGRVNACADAATLRTVLQSRRIALVALRAAGFAHQLVDSRHAKPFLKTSRQPEKTRSAKKREYNTDGLSQTSQRPAFHDPNTRCLRAPHFVCLASSARNGLTRHHFHCRPAPRRTR